MEWIEQLSNRYRRDCAVCLEIWKLWTLSLVLLDLSNYRPVYAPKDLLEVLLSLKGPQRQEDEWVFVDFKSSLALVHLIFQPPSEMGIFSHWLTGKENLWFTNALSGSYSEWKNKQLVHTMPKSIAKETRTAMPAYVKARTDTDSVSGSVLVIRTGKSRWTICKCGNWMLKKCFRNWFFCTGPRPLGQTEIDCVEYWFNCGQVDF